MGSGAAGAGTKARSKAQPQQPLTPRILVAAHTNVAVDRVLLGLLDAGFSNMLRVGSLPRIAKRLLGVSLHSAGVQIAGPAGLYFTQLIGQAASTCQLSVSATTARAAKACHYFSPEVPELGAGEDPERQWFLTLLCCAVVCR